MKKKGFFYVHDYLIVIRNMHANKLSPFNAFLKCKTLEYILMYFPLKMCQDFYVKEKISVLKSKLSW